MDNSLRMMITEVNRRERDRKAALKNVSLQLFVI